MNLSISMNTVLLMAVFALGFSVGGFIDHWFIPAYASNAIAAPPANLTVVGNTTAIPYPGNDSMIAQNVSRVNVTLLGTNAILNLDPMTFTGSIQVIGEVFNNGTQNINSSNFFIPATLYDVNGTIVGTFSTVPELPVIDANNSSPFKVTFFDADVKNGVLGALFYKVQADNKSVFGVLPPPPPLGLGVGAGGGLPLGPAIPNGVPFGFPPLGPMMGLPGPILGPPITPIPTTNQTTTNQTQPQTNQTQVREQPDQDCLFDTSLPKCAADENGQCPDGFNLNEDGNCFPQHSRCPEGYHSEEDNETGECYPDSKPCPPGMVMDPDFPTCVNLTVQFCEDHQDIPECKDFLEDKQIALTSNATNANQTNGQEQEEEVQAQEGQTTAGPASVLSGPTGQTINIEPEPEPQEQQQQSNDQTGAQNNQQNTEEEEEDD